MPETWQLGRLGGLAYHNQNLNYILWLRGWAASYVTTDRTYKGLGYLGQALNEEGWTPEQILSHSDMVWNLSKGRLLPPLTGLGSFSLRINNSSRGFDHESY